MYVGHCMKIYKGVVNVVARFEKKKRLLKKFKKCAGLVAVAGWELKFRKVKFENGSRFGFKN